MARLTRADRLKGCPKRRFRRRPNTTASYPVAKNLLKQDFTADRPNQRWASDITQVWTRQGWLYLSVVKDLYSRRIVGWAMDRAVGRHLVVEALTMADRIAVLNAGRLQQLGTPEGVYDRPANRFVAGFVGTPPMNLWPASVGPDGLVRVEGVDVVDTSMRPITGRRTVAWPIIVA